MFAPTELMRLAIDKAREGIAAGQSPFGCAIAWRDDLVSVAHNEVLATTDITSHAEMVAIRRACQQLSRIHLTDCVVATTCEPCPMCLSALHWARVRRVYYGATIADAAVAGFNELQVPAAELARLGGSRLELTGDVLPQECRQLFVEFAARPGRRVY